MKVHGKILAVTTRPVGAEVSQASTGAIVRVRDASMFDTTGGVLSFDGVEYPYVAADPDDEAGDSVTLAAPLTVEEGDRLALVPVKQEVVATVRVWDDAEPVPAVVPLTLRKRIPEGVRDAATAETVAVDLSDGAVVVDIVGDDGHVKTVWQIDPGGAFVAGDLDGPRAELGYDGLRVWREADGVVFPHSQFTTDSTSLAIYDEQGSMLGGITSGGAVTGTSVSTDALSVRGVPVVGTFGGESTPGWLDRLPWGMQPGWTAASTLFTSYKAVDTEWVYVKLRAVVLRADRRYRITAGHRAALEKTDGVFRSRLRVDRTGGEPTVANEELDQYTTGKVHAGTVTLAANHIVSFSPTATGPHSFVITYQGMNGSRCAARSGRIFIEDVGPYTNDTGGDENTGSSTTRYTTVWKANAARTYDKTGAFRPGQEGKVSAWYRRESPTDYQAPVILFGAGADRSTHPAEVGKGIGAALSGATDVKATLTLKNRHWFGAESGRVPYGQLNAATLPDTLTAATERLSLPTNAGETISLSLPAAWFTGTNRGVVLGEADGAFGSTELGSFVMGGVAGDACPELTIEYTR